MDTKKKKVNYIDRLITYIEHNLEADIDTECLLKVGYLSHTQLYREFYSTTGHSVKEYIRKRRLSNALARVKTSNIPLCDIAYQCGYSSQQALCRAVKNAIGQTPLEYKSSETYYFFPPFTGKALQNIKVVTEQIPDTRCIRFYHSSLKGIEDKAISHFLSIIPDYKGRIFGRNAKRVGTKFCYELYINCFEGIASVIESSEFELANKQNAYKAVFAITTVKNDEKNINDAWDYLYSTWLSASMFRYTNEPYFEEYLLNRKGPVKLKLYFPVEKRSDSLKLSIERHSVLRFLVSKAEGYQAEKVASKNVMDYLAKEHPHMLRAVKECYVQRGEGNCICGVRTKTGFPISKHPKLQNLVLDDTMYLTFHSDSIADYEKCRNMLLSFARDNGLIAERTMIFAVYSIRDGFAEPKMAMYCPIKMVQNDNTNPPCGDIIELSKNKGDEQNE
jgi:AraC family transcriptional regulator